MKAKLVVCLILASYIGSLSCEQTSPKRFNIVRELSKIKPWTLQELKNLWGDYLHKYDIMKTNFVVLKLSSEMIGHEEMRKSLGFPPPGPWSSYNDTKFSEEEINSATSIEAYYEMKEQNRTDPELREWTAVRVQSLAVEYMDKRAPQIRTVYKRRFEEIRQMDTGVVDREVVDRMVTEFEKVKEKVYSFTVGEKLYIMNMEGHRMNDCNSDMNNFTFVSPNCFMSNPILPSELTLPSGPIDTDFSKIPCLEMFDIEILWNDTFSAGFALSANQLLVQAASQTIAAQEFRRALGLTPEFSWTRQSAPRMYVWTEEDLENESLDEYLGRDQSIYYRIWTTKLSERGTSRMVAYLDYRLPEIRASFKAGFEDMLRKNGGWMNKASVDLMIVEFGNATKTQADKYFSKCAEPLAQQLGLKKDWF